MEREVFWTHYPGFIDDQQKWFDQIYAEIDGITVSLENIAYGKTFLTPRKSCYFASTSTLDKKVHAQANLFSYDDLPHFDWSQSPSIAKLKKMVESKLKTTFDYCLAHIYRDGHDYIGYHCDKEALNSDVASLSFGATRKFRMRRVGETKGYEYQVYLAGGDLFHMHTGCQRHYVHTVPKEVLITEPRINLTFRKYQ